MTEIETVKPTDFVTAARAACDDADAVRNSQLERERITQIINIGKHLADRGIEPTGDPFTNWASGRVCVPIVAPGWDVEAETQIHAVAVEWDGDAAELGMPLVADGDLDEDWKPKRLYPAGRLAGLLDVGRAIANGARLPDAPPTAADRIRWTLTSVSADHGGPNAEAILAAAAAVSTALLDIAAAIRETGTAH